MKDWKPIRLGDITDWFSGGTPSKQTEEFWGGDIPWISARTLKNTRISSSELNITQLGLENGSRLAIKDDILILVRGSGLFNFIPISIVEKSVAFNQDIKSIRIKDYYKWISPWFLLFWFHSNRRLLNGIMEVTGIGAGKFDTKILQDLIINLPPIDELNFITKTIKAFDDKIELLQQQNQTLETIAQTIFKQWFGKYQLGDELPEGWRIGKLGEMVKLKSGFAFNSNDFIENGKYKLVTIRNVQDGSFVEDTKDQLKIVPQKTPKYCFLKTGDILLSLTGNVGRVCHLVGENYILNQRVSKVEPRIKKHYGYTYLLFRDKFIFNMMINIASGTAQQNLSPIQTENIDFILPDEKILDQFSRLVNPMFEKILINKIQIQSLTKTRDTLLPKLMSGQVRVKM